METTNLNMTKAEFLKSIEPKLHLLTPKEMNYWLKINATSGVLNIVGKPGFAKTQILRSIAKKLGLNILDFRLPTMDEVDLGCYPNAVNVDGVTVVKRLAPEWVINANSQPTLIIFEELNRATRYVRNAAMGILLEREVGDMKLNSTVFMCATGNLGDEDDCDVDELDTAQKTRLITKRHDLTIKEWVEGYAAENIHKTIIGFLQANPKYWDYSDKDLILNPRVWSFLSDFIVENFGINAEYDDISQYLDEAAPDYIKHVSGKYIQYCINSSAVTLEKILKNPKKYLPKFDVSEKIVKSEIISELKQKDADFFKTKKVHDITVHILKNSDIDSAAGLVYDLFLKITDPENLDNCHIAKIVRHPDIYSTVTKKCKETLYMK